MRQATPVSYTINVKTLRWKYFRYIRGHHYTAKYSPRIVHHVILVTLGFAIDLLWNFFDVALLPGSPWRRFTRPQGTTCHTNPTTGHHRSQKAGTRSCDRESVKKEGQWSLYREDEYMNRKVLLWEQLAAAASYESKAIKRPVNLYLFA